MKKLLIQFFTLSSLLFSAQSEHISIGDKEFVIKTEYYKIYNSEGKVMKLYIKDLNNSLTFLTGLTLEDNTGACTNKSIQKGAYDLNSSHITLYSLWDRSSKFYNAPYGGKIQQYKLLKDNTLDLIYSRIYIESDLKNFNLETGMQYLFNPPKTEAEKALLNEYIKDIEKRYKGTFVFDNDARSLINDVNAALEKQMKKRWK